MSLFINTLTVTQNGLRNAAQLSSMVDFVAKGGKFDPASMHAHSNGLEYRVINLVQFENTRLFIHDGHHRIAAIYLGGRTILHPEEYRIKEWKYQDYIDINLDAKWVTPFDPRTEVRVNDYTEFKWNVLHTGLSAVQAEEYIRLNKADYVRPRRLLTIIDLLNQMSHD